MKKYKWLVLLVFILIVSSWTFFIDNIVRQGGLLPSDNRESYKNDDTDNDKSDFSGGENSDAYVEAYIEASNTEKYDLPLSENIIEYTQEDIQASGDSDHQLLQTDDKKTATQGVVDGTNDTVSVCFAGDILLDRGVKRTYAEHGFNGIFADGSLAGTADIIMSNLESPFSLRGTPEEDKEWTFRGDPEHIVFLSELGVDIVTVANNHSMDFGRDALADTLELLRENGVAYVGGGENEREAASYVIFEVKGYKIAFIGASRVLPTTDWRAGENRSGLFSAYDTASVVGKIKEAAAEADYVAVFIHWGVERDARPQEWQREMGKQLIDAGASCVIGSHPHVLQGFEYYNGKPIVYSLGNFVYTDSNKDTMTVTVTFGDEIRLSARPYVIRNMRTTPATDADRERILAHLRDISFDVGIDEGFEVRERE